MIDEEERDSPTYLGMQEKIISLLKQSATPLTAGRIRSILGTDEFLGDALEILKFSGAITIGGSVLLPTYSYNSSNERQVNMQTCVRCLAEKPLIEFYQEWSGRPSSTCKSCKIAAQKRCGRRNRKS